MEEKDYSHKIAPLTKKLSPCQKKKITRRLVNTWGEKCWYCGIQTVPPPADGSPLLSDSRTIEHLYTNQDIIRLLVKNNFEFLRIACHSCNQAMAKEKRKEVEQFNSHPQNYYNELLRRLLLLGQEAWKYY